MLTAIVLFSGVTIIVTSLERRFEMFRMHRFIKARTDNTYFADDMDKYGCWCGQTGNGNPVDDLVRCCYKHHSCLNKVFSDGCRNDAEYYEYTMCFSILVRCTDGDECKNTFCECDSELANCFSSYKKQYNVTWKEGNKTYCRTM